MSVDSLTTTEDKDDAVSNEELLELFEEQKQRINDLENELEHEREQRQELEDTVQKFKNRAGPAISKFINELATNSDETVGWDDGKFMMTAINAADTMQERSQRLQSVEEATQRHESKIEESRSLSADPQAEHWQRVVEKANNVQGMAEHSLADNWVRLEKEDIAGAIEPGPTRAGQLIDEWTDSTEDKRKQGAEKQPYRPPSSSRNGAAQKKALKIDLDVWGEE